MCHVSTSQSTIIPKTDSADVSRVHQSVNNYTENRLRRCVTCPPISQQLYRKQTPPMCHVSTNQSTIIPKTDSADVSRVHQSVNNYTENRLRRYVTCTPISQQLYRKQTPPMCHVYSLVTEACISKSHIYCRTEYGYIHGHAKIVFMLDNISIICKLSCSLSKCLIFK